jgi:ketosteroid isomerase-like protein
MGWRKEIMTLVLIGYSLNGSAQITHESQLYELLAKKDSILFNAAFNTCDTLVLEDIFTEDFEFYHDKGGITKGRDSFLNPIKSNCSNRDAHAPQPAKRILVAGSLKVYPLYKDEVLYGAIQHGIHSFEFLNEKEEYEKGDIAKFTHIWVKENGKWRVKRELSYDHKPQKI